ncbi:hypothetical protein CkaCkLH20_06190 [Colletotrichum karsti]|uniref:SP-RING-type domain-containing protein n=1 Tax=Colletotrichum karsti TaxID=1095194 RepID=A0A9P6I5R5_9PEZI|nr:uncharacterized protein CkaCkLH20_06190 [Colletotrichum karsti]KAF9876247.1 hypothetical protein CkaCkLH20_06190 [Colletotrichum karsti]
MPILDRRRQQRRPERRVADNGDDQTLDLPPYEPLACPLTNEAKRAIAELSNTRDVHRYQTHIKNSIQHLGQSVMDINDVTRDTRDSVARVAAKRPESALEDKSERELGLEKHLAALEADVPTISAEAEAALRDLIDRQVQLEDDKAALVATVDYFQSLPAPAARPRRGQQDGEGEGQDEDVEMPPPEQSVIDTLRQHRAEKQREYERLNAYQRYALNNDYAAFKKLWHESVHGDNGPPVPNAKRWFDDAGNPVVPRMSAGQDVKNEGGAAEDDEDDDLIIASEVRDYRCPLSMAEFQEPYSNHVCNHTYEKQWLVDMLRKAPGGRGVCAVPGCEKSFQLSDFYDDRVILRKMKRAQELQRLAEQEGSSSSDDDDDDRPAVKSERRSQGRKRKMETIDDDDE